MQSLGDIKSEMIDAGIVKSDDELGWLTDEVLADRSSREKEKEPATDDNGVHLLTVDYGNHFYTTNGGAVWHWESGDNTAGGNLACGRNHAWMYNRRVGDSYVQAGNCNGYPYWRFDIYH
jgi:hypothetical protein